MMGLNRLTTGMVLADLLDGLADAGTAAGQPVTGVSMDSRRTRKGDLFLACRGEHTDGARYIDAALRAGAVAVALEPGQAVGAVPGTPIIEVADLKLRAGLIAARFHGHPARGLDVIGVTGTNGKTSVTSFLAEALALHDGIDCGLIGTLGYGCRGGLQPGANTTPDPLRLQELLAGFRDQGLRRVVMEVSSHALTQGRVAGVEFHTAVFTNLSLDHLDYHGDMDAYGAAKKRLFLLDGVRHGVINTDDGFGAKLARELAGSLPLTSYRLVEEFTASGAAGDEVQGRILAGAIDWLNIEIRSSRGQGRLTAPFGGRFNAYNLLACVAVLVQLGVPFDSVLGILSRVTPVPGRLEAFGGGERPLVIVDYAHTPDALENVLMTLREQVTGRLICVFGCGGDRDQGKRPHMGAIAQRYADQIIITSDNPRHEDPEAIIRDITRGITDSGRVNLVVDRAQAITRAVQEAVTGDVVLVAGKGHETYQDIGGRRHPFSDRQMVRKLLETAP